MRDTLPCVVGRHKDAAPSKHSVLTFKKRGGGTNRGQRVDEKEKRKKKSRLMQERGGR